MKNNDGNFAAFMQSTIYLVVHYYLMYITCSNCMLEPMYTSTDFTSIAQTLTPGRILNPHESILGWGNYDVNVVIMALQMKGYETI